MQDVCIDIHSFQSLVMSINWVGLENERNLVRYALWLCVLVYENQINFEVRK